MNNRIKSLLAQAHLEVKEEFGIIDTNQVAERFAELLIKECASMVRVYRSHEYDFTGDLELDEFMLNHFGVEE